MIQKESYDYLFKKLIKSELRVKELKKHIKFLNEKLEVLQNKLIKKE